jgi:hypothetical protein
MLFGATIRLVLQVLIGNFKLRHLPSTNKMVRGRNKTMEHTIRPLSILIRNNTKLQIRKRDRYARLYCKAANLNM